MVNSFGVPPARIEICPEGTPQLFVINSSLFTKKAAPCPFGTRGGIGRGSTLIYYSMMFAPGCTFSPAVLPGLSADGPGSLMDGNEDTLSDQCDIQLVVLYHHQKGNVKHSFPLFCKFLLLILANSRNFMLNYSVLGIFKDYFFEFYMNKMSKND